MQFSNEPCDWVLNITIRSDFSPLMIFASDIIIGFDGSHCWDAGFAIVSFIIIWAKAEFGGRACFLPLSPQVQFNMN